MRNLRFCLSLCLLFCATFVSAQRTAVHHDKPVNYKAATDLFDKEKFSAAQKKFDEIIQSTQDPNDEWRVNAEYYKALCALKLFNKDAVFLLAEFVKRHPESKWIEPAYFQLGNYYYRKKEYEQVVEYFSKVSDFRLSDDEKTEYKFKLGYSQMKLGDSQKAINNLNDIAGKASEYYAPANYYLAHLNYESKNYQTALLGFEKIKDEKGFQDIVPYYIAHIYFLQAKYDRVIEYATPLISTVEAEQATELNKLVGESYYNKLQYTQAIPYLEAFAAQSENKAIGDYYQLGYCYYKTGNYEKAIRQFNPVASEESRLGQTAQYHLADCYLQTGNKVAARTAFLAASKLDYDQQIAEDALFNYAKLAYELSFNPYHEAITAFKEYLEKYPDTERSDEANEFLFYVFLNTKNYQAGLEALNLIKNKDSRLQQAYQYIAYNRGIELMLAKRNEEAFDLLEKSKTYSPDKKVLALANYWQADIRYSDAKYRQALNQYLAFQKSPGAYSTGFYDEALYNIGYAQFKLAEYSDAATSFRKYVSKPAAIDQKKLNDAYLRIGDAYFVSKQYDLAIDFYQKANKIGDVDPDYGLYQMGMAQGYLGRESDKVATLGELRREFPNSHFTVDAIYETGDAYFKSDQNDKALSMLQSLSRDYPGSAYARRGNLLTGLILYRQKKYDDAISVFKKIAADYPNYEDAREAIARAEDIYVEQGRVEEYNDWVQSLKFYNVSNSALDSTNFRSAENIFDQGDCERSKTAFKSYLSRFPQGLFMIEANFKLAECYYKDKDYANALEHYSAVINRPVNKFTESALVAASYINYMNKNYSLALENYRQLEKVAEFKTNVLEAQIGQMRCYARLRNNIDVIVYADKVLSDQNTPQKIKTEAQVNKARSYINMGDLENANKLYTEIAATTKTVEGAEGRYYMAYVLYTKNDLKKAEVAALEVLKPPSYDEWMAKAVILLADIYVKMDDLFQAKANLQSVIDNYDGAELVDEAKKKLQVIIDRENAAKPQEQKPQEIKLDGYDKKYDKLYDEEQKKKEQKPVNAPAQPNNQPE
ncbi:MAG: tetratricopeptide repeat protein [Bacteroidota bacterium]